MDPNHIHDLFKAYDTNNDKKLNKFELGCLMRDLDLPQSILSEEQITKYMAE